MKLRFPTSVIMFRSSMGRIFESSSGFTSPTRGFFAMKNRYFPTSTPR